MPHVLRKSQLVLDWNSGPLSEAISAGIPYVTKTQCKLLTDPLAPYMR